jgi:hypothetical protein
VGHLPERFAVDVAHAIDVDHAGEWIVDGGTAEWRYLVQIPGASSLSLHATRARLPASAVLTVRAGDNVHTYRAADTNDGGLWSRILKGDTLDLALTVPAGQRVLVSFDVESFQAGFRRLDDELARGDEPSRRVTIQSASEQSHDSCVQNHACNVTTANSGPGKATVAVVVRNTTTCTGTLLNDSLGDKKPYVLTARHCQNSDGALGSPPARSDVSIYWNAVTTLDAPPAISERRLNREL